MHEQTPSDLYTFTRGVPAHLAAWQLPPSWAWGAEGVASDFRQSQDGVDSLGRREMAQRTTEVVLVIDIARSRDGGERHVRVARLCHERT